LALADPGKEKGKRGILALAQVERGENMPAWARGSTMRRLNSRLPQKFGTYVLLRPLGEGGMGTVSLAMSGHRDLETLCVVKRLLPALASQPDQVRHFRHEADLARQLVHSNLAHTHNIGEVDGEVFLVQEFVEGHDVSALLERMAAQGRVLPVPVAVYIVGEIARGLSYAHDFEGLNLVHRDINPPNVRLTYAGEVKLLDFGIASSDLRAEGPGQDRAAGKLWHLAPEQLRPGDKLDRRTDIYALGVLLWQLLTQRPVGTVRDQGRETRPAETEGEILTWVSRGEHQPPSIFNSEVPPELDAVVKQATSVRPEGRFANADELRRALAVFIPPEVHPELWLSLAMKEIFAPEQERADRRQLVESARHLLDDDGLPERRRARSASQPKANPVLLSDSIRQKLRFVAPIAVGGLVGLCVLLWLRLTVERDKTATAAAPPSLRVSPSLPAPPPMPAPTMRVPERPSTPAVGSPPGTVSHTMVDGKGGRPSVPPKRAEAGAELPAAAAPPARTDHLELARDAFNARDWPRAIEEGKRAVAAGGGAEAHSLVGNTYFKMGRFAEAEQEYTKAISLEPENALLRDRLNIAHARVQESTLPGKP
jgi:serine/threonine protein kinase